VNVEKHLLTCARQVSSPNCNERPVPIDPELIVIHCISLPPGEFGGPYIEQLFQNRLCADEHPYFREIHQLQVSSHLLIRRDGEVLQFVPFNLRAWHAGQSCYGDRENCNDYSIGIELEGTEDSAFEPIQYERLKQVIECLQNAYGVTVPGNNPSKQKLPVVGHSDIAPGRKTDPGPCFDWSQLS